ncbi:MAG TPA: hypothetical protein ENJ31_01340 [Anaerolineae bacterium]|nr:hypothetical protein [Anaerolineae bacterium]
MRTKTWIGIVLSLLGGLVLVGVVLAAPTATSIERWVMAGGGGHAEAASYALDGTIGQPVVGGIGNGSTEIGAGFWGGMGAAAGAASRIYLPLVLRGDSP